MKVEASQDERLFVLLTSSLGPGEVITDIIVLEILPYVWDRITISHKVTVFVKPGENGSP